MDKLYAPWRDCYVQGQTKGNQLDTKEHCIFCEVFHDQVDNQNRFILYKDAMVAAMLNLYPYNGGHVLVFSREHVDQFYLLSEQVQNSLMHVATKTMKILKDTLRCDGINFGANVGKTAGAGIPDHVHIHIVPRWSGDTGFLSIIGETKQVSVDLEKIYKQLKAAFDKSF